MKAYQVVKYASALVCKNVKVPEPKEFEVLAKTLVSGVCHTDLHVINGDLSTDEKLLPITPGHEGIGTVVSVGPKVKSLKIGDRIGVAWLGKACTECFLCKSGRSNLCEKQLRTGYTLHGSFAEYFVADERFAAKIPTKLSNEAAAPILCAGLTTYKALKALNATKGARIVITGACGGLGHLAVQYASLMGFEVIALDILDDKCEEMLKGYGVKFFVNVKDSTNTPIQERLAQIPPINQPIEGAIILAPVLSSITDAVKYVSSGGTIVCVALPPGMIQIPCVDFVIKGLHLVASIVGNPEDLNEALKIAAENGVTPKTQVHDHSEINSVLSELHKGKLKGRAVIHF